MAEPTQLAFRTLKDIGILKATPVYEAPAGFTRPEGNLRCSIYSPNGKFFAWATPEQVTVVDPSTGHIVTTLPAPNVYEIGFSPLGTFIIIWQRPGKDDTGNAIKNLRVWRTIDDSANNEGERQVVGEFVQKSQTGWNLQYTADEKFCARLVTNQVQFYESEDLGTVWNKLHIEGVSDFAITPGIDKHSVAVFVPERKGQPAAVKVFNVPQFETPVSQKTFFKGDKVQFKWNDLGTSLIVLASTEVDKSNKSYYGETNMYILSANGGFDSRIQLDKEGPIHDVTWSPNGKEFGVVYGYMPAKTTIFNTRAVATHNFNLAPRNTILFSPHGRFVLVAGFGNLAGQMDIYDLQKDYTKICTIEASNASVCEWSPDGKHILTATTSPRLRVDNGLRIWHFQGGLMYKEDMDELYEVRWRPESIEKYPLQEPFTAQAPHASALVYLSTVKTPSKPAGAYRPPGARGTLTPLHFKREDEGGAAFDNTGISSTSGQGVNGFGAKPRRREVPGAETVEPTLPPGAAPGGGVSLTVGDDENLSKAALKNKKKREAKKAKDAAEKADGESSAPASAPASTPASGNRLNGRSASRNQTQPQQSGQRREGSRQRGPNATPQPARASPAPTPAPAAVPSTPRPQPVLNTAVSSVVANDSAESPGLGSPHEKKLRALHKKLRAIEDLKMRQAGGEKLELSQISKIKTEDSVKKELDALE